MFFRKKNFQTSNNLNKFYFFRVAFLTTSFPLKHCITWVSKIHSNYSLVILWKRKICMRKRSIDSVNRQGYSNVNFRPDFSQNILKWMIYDKTATWQSCEMKKTGHEEEKEKNGAMILKILDLRYSRKSRKSRVTFLHGLKMKNRWYLNYKEIWHSRKRNHMIQFLLKSYSICRFCACSWSYSVGNWVLLIMTFYSFSI